MTHIWNVQFIGQQSFTLFCLHTETDFVFIYIFFFLKYIKYNSSLRKAAGVVTANAAICYLCQRSASFIPDTTKQSCSATALCYSIWICSKTTHTKPIFFQRLCRDAHTYLHKQEFTPATRKASILILYCTGWSRRGSVYVSLGTSYCSAARCCCKNWLENPSPRDTLTHKHKHERKYRETMGKKEGGKGKNNEMEKENEKERERLVRDSW